MKIGNYKLKEINGRYEYSDSLDLAGTGITSLPDNLTVGGFLDLRGTGITSLPDNLTVGDSLDLRGTGITSLPDNLTVGDSLDLRGTGITSLPDNLTVGGSLDLERTGITSLPDNLTVGGFLDLAGTGITSLPDNLTVGGSLYLRGTGITSLPDNLTVGGFLDLAGTGITNTEHVKKDVPKVLYWKNGKYLKADGIFSEVVSKKSNCWKLKSIGKSEVFFLATDGSGKFAHGKTIKQAKADLIYKLSDGVDKEQFKNLSQDSVLTFEQCIELYRSVTGACAFGVKRFIESNNIENRSYTLAEIIKKTDGQYGSDALKAFYGFR